MNFSISLELGLCGTVPQPVAPLEVPSPGIWQENSLNFKAILSLSYRQQVGEVMWLGVRGDAWATGQKGTQTCVGNGTGIIAQSGCDFHSCRRAQCGMYSAQILPSWRQSSDVQPVLKFLHFASFLPDQSLWFLHSSYPECFLNKTFHDISLLPRRWFTLLWLSAVLEHEDELVCVYMKST